MVANAVSVTAAPARTSAPVVPRVDPVGSGSPEAAGKDAAAGGRTLPPDPPQPPVVDVERAVERLNELMSSAQRSLRFRVDANSGRTVITVINETTQEIVRQIPSEEVLAVSRSLEDLGSLIDTRI
jgi:flagellar protein FlaG